MSHSTTYIVVSGPDAGNEECRDSIHNIQQRPGDEGPVFGRGTKGYEVRQQHLRTWYEQTEHDYILLLDRDMVFPAHTLERLRAHGLPFVSGFYPRRSLAPIAPVWLRPWSGEWPYEPMLDALKPDQLYPIGASGWGCILIHRDVITQVRPILKGEPEIIEDDMDIRPYDLRAVLRALRDLRRGFDQRDDNLQAEALHVLEAEICPLRVDKSTAIGSDIRFAYYALQAGFQLYGDTGVNCGHMVDYPLSLNDWSIMPAEIVEKIKARTLENMQGERDNLAVLQRAVVGNGR